MKPLALVFGALFALSACGGKDDTTPLGSPPRHRIPGCEALDPAPCDVRTSACEERLFAVAACLRGDAAGEPPPVSVWTEDDYRSELEVRAAANEPDPNEPDLEQAFVMLGLADAGAFDTSAMIEQSVKWIWGFYDDETQAIVVIDHGDAAALEESSSVLVHEFVHALQDRQTDLHAYTDAHFALYDSGLAADAVIEGEARFHEQHYRASMLGYDPRTIDWDALFENGVSADESWIFQQPARITAGWRSFPYEWGARAVNRSWATSGAAGIAASLAEPPVTTGSLMVGAGESFDVTPSTLEAPAPGAGFDLVGEERLGAFGAFLVLGELTELASARELALGWRGDELAVYSDAGERAGAHTTVAAWLVEFDEPSTASAVGALLARQFGSSSVRTDGARLTFALSSNGSRVDWVLDPAP